jgi:hypothetical protein
MHTYTDEYYVDNCIDLYMNICIYARLLMTSAPQTAQLVPKLILQEVYIYMTYTM